MARVIQTEGQKAGKQIANADRMKAQGYKMKPKQSKSRMKYKK